MEWGHQSLSAPKSGPLRTIPSNSTTTGTPASDLDGWRTRRAAQAACPPAASKVRITTSTTTEEVLVLVLVLLIVVVVVVVVAAAAAAAAAVVVAVVWTGESVTEPRSVADTATPSSSVSVAAHSMASVTTSGFDSR
jgi:K+-sensing histidine kinase KdpD